MGTNKTESPCGRGSRGLYLLPILVLATTFLRFLFLLYGGTLVIYLLHQLLFALHFPIFLIIIIKSMYCISRRDR